MINVFIVDDHPFVRQGLRTYLATQPGITICGEAGEGDTAFFEILRLQPDVAVVDLHLPGKNGIELTRDIKKEGLSTKVIVLSSFSEDHEVLAAVEAGASSYLLKDSSPQKLVEAIHAALNNESVLHPRIAKKLMEMVGGEERSVEPLTSKEQEVLALLVNGNSNKEIAEALFISATTVKSHISSILRKLDVNDRTQAVIKALKLKLVKEL